MKLTAKYYNAEQISKTVRRN